MKYAVEESAENAYYRVDLSCTFEVWGIVSWYYVLRGKP